VLGRASSQLNGPSQQAQLLEGYRRHGPHVVARAHPSDLAHLKARNDSYTGNSLALVSYAWACSSHSIPALRLLDSSIS